MHDRSNIARGQWGETRARRHLERVGHLILDRNWRSPERHVRGELDIVSLDGAVVVFSEVKARRRGSFGGAAAAVDDRKQQQIRALAESWLRVNGDRDERVRFDVIAIDGVHLTHFDDAF